MSKAIETIDYKGHEIKVYFDDFPEDPRQWENIGKMICFHKRYSLGDEHSLNFNDYDNWDDLRKQIKRTYNVAAILPLFLYDHSGITISTGSFSCQWDSGQVGFIIMERETMNREFAGKNKLSMKKREEYLRNEVETYDNYLTGQIFGYETIDLNGEEIDSCWSFYGQEDMVSTAKKNIDYQIKHAFQERVKRKKIEIKNKVPLNLRINVIQEAC